MRKSLSVPVSIGEVIDKITILQIKSERITDTTKLKNIGAELDLLSAAMLEHAGEPSPDVAGVVADLKGVNQALWDIEDDIRALEKARDFGGRFVELARAVYITNDRRSVLKRRLNEMLGSTLVEEKSYADYS